MKLSNNELSSLNTIFRRGATAARGQPRARVLDFLHRGQPPNTIAATLGLSLPTVFTIKRRSLPEGFAAALYDKPRAGKPLCISGEARAKLTALACSTAPAGHARWSLRLLAARASKLGFVDTISHNAVIEILQKTN
jgi:putative transposase